VLADEPLGEFLGVGEGGAGAVLDDGFGGGGVEEEAGFGFGDGEAEGGEGGDEEVHAAGVFRGDFLGDFGVVERGGGGVLDGEELAGVGIVFHVAVGADGLGVAADPADAPAGHVEGFGEGVEFEGDVFGAGDLEDGEGAAFEDEGGVGGVVDDEEVVLAGEGDGVFEEGKGGGGAGGVVGVVEDEDFGVLEEVGGDGGEVGEEIILRGEGEVADAAAVVAGVGAEDGVAGRGHDDAVAGVDEAGGEDGEGGFGADAVEDFGVGVEVDAEEAAHVAGGGLLEFGAAVVGVAAVFGLGGGVLEGVDDVGEGHFVGLADAEVNEGRVGVGGAGGGFGALDFLEFIDGGGLAVVRAADAVGEELLEEVGHGGKRKKVSSFEFGVSRSREQGEEAGRGSRGLGGRKFGVSSLEFRVWGFGERSP
jgi:hypothetical protein